MAWQQSQYQWASDSRGRFRSVDPQLAGDTLQSIYAERGRLDAVDVIQAAQPEDSPLHPAFTWDDTVAAQQWRKAEARDMMNHLVVAVITRDAEEEETTRLVRAVVNLPASEDDLTDRTYMPLTVAMTDEQKRARMLLEARRELRSVRRKYADLQELADIFAAIDALPEFGEALPVAELVTV